MERIDSASNVSRGINLYGREYVFRGALKPEWKGQFVRTKESVRFRRLSRDLAFAPVNRSPISNGGRHVLLSPAVSRLHSESSQYVS